MAIAYLHWLLSKKWCIPSSQPRAVCEGKSAPFKTCELSPTPGITAPSTYLGEETFHRSENTSEARLARFEVDVRDDNVSRRGLEHVSTQVSRGLADQREELSLGGDPATGLHFVAPVPARQAVERHDDHLGTKSGNVEYEKNTGADIEFNKQNGLTEKLFQLQVLEAHFKTIIEQPSKLLLSHVHPLCLPL